MRLPALCLALLSAAAFAAEPFLRSGDVIALVGGEDMVVAGEYGYLELLLTRALPEHRLKFRTLAWEGDTVFEQRRDLNFPPLEKQLDEVGATVVICQFGQMESLAGKEKLPEFVAAYEKLIDRMRGGGKRRIALIEPHSFEPRKAADGSRAMSSDVAENFRNGVTELAYKFKLPCVGACPVLQTDNPFPARTRDGVHLIAVAQLEQARVATFELRWGGHGLFGDHRADAVVLDSLDSVERDGTMATSQLEKLRLAIIAKNRLWFDYWRVENWAFLAGDRTSQPSSRDHLDKDKRWFPAERDRFLPLIEAREKEIWEAAAKLARP